MFMLLFWLFMLAVYVELLPISLRYWRTSGVGIWLLLVGLFPWVFATILVTVIGTALAVGYFK